MKEDCGVWESAILEVKEDVLYILDKLRLDRSFLNKHFQNSMCNYFLGDNAGALLKSSLNILKVKDITKYVYKKYDELSGPKYIKLMHGYFTELKAANLLEELRKSLLQNVIYNNYSLENQKPSKEWQCWVWRRAFSLFVYHGSDPNNELTTTLGIFEIWNSLFPNEEIQRKRQLNVSHRMKSKFIVLPDKNQPLFDQISSDCGYLAHQSECEDDTNQQRFLKKFFKRNYFDAFEGPTSDHSSTLNDQVISQSLKHFVKLQNGNLLAEGESKYDKHSDISQIKENNEQLNDIDQNSPLLRNYYPKAQNLEGRAQNTQSFGNKLDSTNLGVFNQYSSFIQQQQQQILAAERDDVWRSNEDNFSLYEIGEPVSCFYLDNFINNNF